ncbi:hypothetical protein EDB81DRAFT_140803 [Dactylonectria macrodidyma]|uniref:Uncharacterized protein n=1 Tax=Dactylonectria macrodidyma TaxID=307937 RepID=A0A9P9ILY7_9HYPO|nr:hypothetical protein EDB81DRAFT_140803 [Dactylonectria macrodidyma]
MGQLRSSLEQYFLDFPSRLLRLRDLEHVYQAEAMVWLHGIYIISYVSRDMFDLMLSNSWASKPEFYSAYEHSLLLAEVIPTVLRLDLGAQTLSPATVFFVLLSSIVTAVALWQFHVPLGEGQSTSILGVPDSLFASVNAHLKLLNAFWQRDTRYDIDLIEAVFTILSTLSKNLDHENYTSLQASLVHLAHYRWCQGGLGINKLTESAVRSGWYPDHQHWQVYVQLVSSTIEADTHQRKMAIESLGRSDARVCQSGFFDLNIRFV